MKSTIFIPIVQGLQEAGKVEWIEEAKSAANNALNLITCAAMLDFPPGHAGEA